MLFPNFESDIIPPDVVQEVPRTSEHQVGLVIDLAQMSKENDLQSFMGDALQQFEGFGIGEMSVATANALFQRKRVGAIEQQFRVVIGFQD